MGGFLAFFRQQLFVCVLVSNCSFQYRVAILFGTLFFIRICMVHVEKVL